MRKTCGVLFLVAWGLPVLAGERVTLSLDGTWQIDQSVSPGDLPAAFRHQVPVPGMANLAQPPFAGVDQFDSRELINNRVRRKRLPASALVETVGIPRQDRNYFWYQKLFTVPARRQVAMLKINKAQFGTAVWLNGHKIGEHLGCFTAGYFNLTEAIDWKGQNRLVARVGAHPAALPPSVPAGTDFEKLKWTPGIYDSVSLALSDNPVIETVQVAPRIRSSGILVQTLVKNHGATPIAFRLSHRVKTWQGGNPVGRPVSERLSLQPGEERTRLATIRIPSPTLWTPENPFLYVVESSTGGDSLATRFGMREFRFDTATRRAYLNDKIYFLRGSNITLHRFFEDPKCGALPWNETWVRKLLADIPKRMHWNSFRLCIGPAPDRWLDIADEAGLLIQNEFFIWTGRDGWHKEWDPEELITQYKEWMRDNWNHPSVAIWDSNNETIAGVLGDKVIPAVRFLDLSNRPWENGYNLPQGPDDPVEDHPYLFSRVAGREPRFRVTDLEQMTGGKTTNAGHPTGHPVIINEYGWLWLNRDGNPTELTRDVYATLLGPNSTAQQRLELNAYLLSGLTEFWRAHRNAAGVLHFVYLTSSFPEAFTSDHFRDVEKLELEPHFQDYIGEAFKPLGVYLNFWQPTLKAGSERSYAVMMINDDPETAQGKLALSLENSEGKPVARSELSFSVPGLGQQTYKVNLRTPAAPGEYLLKASAAPEGRRRAAPTVSRRRVEVVN